MIDQLEFADVILLNKMDLVNSVKEIKKIRDVIQKLNPRAEIIETTRSRVPINKIINTNKFDLNRAMELENWMERGRYDIQPETEEYNISSFIYTAKRPFDPVKLNEQILEK